MLLCYYNVYDDWIRGLVVHISVQYKYILHSVWLFTMVNAIIKSTLCKIKAYLEVSGLVDNIRSSVNFSTPNKRQHIIHYKVIRNKVTQETKRKHVMRVYK